SRDPELANFRHPSQVAPTGGTRQVFIPKPISAGEEIIDPQKDLPSNHGFDLASCLRGRAPRTVALPPGAG
ncbi:MAG: hypothetical protein OEV00_14165, partial [Acidobacteriota bacterium]|nr:hypothetical protein [Acidobacteriota bacterium]